VPNRENKAGLFVRWLWLVYLPLGVLALAILLIVAKILSGGVIWPVGLLAIYCIVPARLLIETKRKGLQLPKPPGAKPRGTSDAGPSDASRTAARRMRRPASRGGQSFRGLEGDPSPGGEGTESGSSAAKRPQTRPIPAAARPRTEARRATARVAPKTSPKIMRRRALAGVIGIGRVTSSFGLVMVGVGGFLMILSVTLPTFRLVDAALRGVGRLITRRRPAPPPRARRSG
jgi:hypothetical protein